MQGLGEIIKANRDAGRASDANGNGGPYTVRGVADNANPWQVLRAHDGQVMAELPTLGKARARAARFIRTMGA